MWLTSVACIGWKATRTPSPRCCSWRTRICLSAGSVLLLCLRVWAADGTSCLAVYPGLQAACCLRAGTLNWQLFRWLHLSEKISTYLVVWMCVGQAKKYGYAVSDKIYQKAVTSQIKKFSNTDNAMFSSSKDTFVKWWDLDTQHCFRTMVGHRSEVSSTLLLLRAFWGKCSTTDRKWNQTCSWIMQVWIVVCMWSSRLKSHYLRCDLVRSPVCPFVSQVWGLVLLNGEKRLLTGCADSELRAWDIKYLEPVRAALCVEPLMLCHWTWGTTPELGCLSES